MGEVIDLERARTAQQNHERLLRALKLAAATNPNVSTLLNEAADYIEVHPPWVGLAEHRWIEELMRRLLAAEERIVRLESRENGGAK